VANESWRGGVRAGGGEREPRVSALLVFTTSPVPIPSPHKTYRARHVHEVGGVRTHRYQQYRILTTTAADARMASEGSEREAWARGHEQWARTVPGHAKRGLLGEWRDSRIVCRTAS
jgi:hypothetical protein